MMRAAIDHGAELRLGEVTGLALSPDGKQIEGVEVDGSVLPCDVAVIAMGPWSRLAAQWLPLPRVYGLKGHSLLFATGEATPDEAFKAPVTLASLLEGHWENYSNVFEGYWDGTRWLSPGGVTCEPMHWMPLPSPPLVLVQR